MIVLVYGVNSDMNFFLGDMSLLMASLGDIIVLAFPYIGLTHCIECDIEVMK